VFAPNLCMCVACVTALKTPILRRYAGAMNRLIVFALNGRALSRPLHKRTHSQTHRERKETPMLSVGSTFATE